MKKSTIAVIIALVIAVCGFGGWKYYEAGIEKMQDKGVEDLKAAVKLDDYREAEQTEIQSILDDSEKQIRGLKDEAAVDAVVKDAEAKFAEFKTDAEYTAEEEEAARQAELERQRQEEEAAAAAAAAAAASSGSSGGSGGCVGGGSDDFY